MVTCVLGLGVLRVARRSNRDALVQAAMRVAETDGVTAVTMDSVAAAAGMTKSGLLYHFAHRSALLMAIHEHLAQQWDAEMVAALGKAPDHASTREKVAAYVRVTARPLTRAELIYLADAGSDPQLAEPWARIAQRWTPETPEPDDQGRYPETLMRALVARMAADGLWSYETFTGVPLPAELRSEVAERIIAALDPTSSDVARHDTHTQDGSQ